jgi:hypothetical protein
MSWFEYKGRIVSVRRNGMHYWAEFKGNDGVGTATELKKTAEAARAKIRQMIDEQEGAQ